MQRTRIICAFADVTKFGSYAKIASRDPEAFEKFVRDIYNAFASYRGESEHFVKYLGDGFLAIATLVQGHNCQLAVKFLCELHELQDEVNRLIKDLPGFPKPDGFRVRVAAGQVFKIKVSDGEVDFVGYAMNLAARLLRVCPDVPLICHESVKDIIGKKDHIVFQKINAHRHTLDGVEQEDLHALWAFTCCEPKEG